MASWKIRSSVKSCQTRKFASIFWKPSFLSRSKKSTIRKNKKKSKILNIVSVKMYASTYWSKITSTTLTTQTTDNKDLGWRMRYYAAKMDQRYTLDKGKTYRNMKKAYLIFLCNFDPEGEGRIKYTYHTYEDHNKSKQLQDGLEKIIINGKGIPNGENADQVGLVNLINAPLST